MQQIQKPTESEYAAYVRIYIDLVPQDGLVLDHLYQGFASSREFILSFPSEALATRWKPGEWTIKEIILHILDTERIFCYRALRFARNDATSLSGFDQEAYVPNSRANERDIASILEEYVVVRQSTLAFFNSLDEVALARIGLVDGNRVSVRALAWMITGHEIHHLNSLRENYL
jgi:hypothetical protein